MCDFLLLSAAVNGVEMRILGWDEGVGERATWTHDMRTNVKLIAAHKFAATLPRNEVIMLVDAFDTVWQQNPGCAVLSWAPYLKPNSSSLNTVYGCNDGMVRAASQRTFEQRYVSWWRVIC